MWLLLITLVVGAVWWYRGRTPADPGGRVEAAPPAGGARHAAEAQPAGAVAPDGERPPASTHPLSPDGSGRNQSEWDGHESESVVRPAHLDPEPADADAASPDIPEDRP